LQNSKTKQQQLNDRPSLSDDELEASTCWPKPGLARHLPMVKSVGRCCRTNAKEIKKVRTLLVREQFCFLVAVL
jgi:S-methylmethionine-dependent homocysteine/selenocysteine methylase